MMLNCPSEMMLNCNFETMFNCHHAAMVKYHFEKMLNYLRNYNFETILISLRDIVCIRNSEAQNKIFMPPPLFPIVNCDNMRLF